MQKVLTQLEEDLTALSCILRRADPLPPSHVRISASAVLRKWFLDSHLNRLSKSLKVVFTLPVLDTSGIVNAIANDSSITFFLAGGVVMDGIPMRGYYISDLPYEGKVRLPIDTMVTINARPSHFLKSRRVYHNRKWFNIEDILRFVASKCGGVHLDSSREQEWQERLEAAANYFVIGNPDGLQERQIVEPYTQEHRILLVLPKEVGYLWTCLDIELLAAAQSLVNIRCNDQPLLVWDHAT